MKRDTLTDYLHDYLQVDLYSDLAPNGLQAEGKNEIKKMLVAVSASVELFTRAIAAKADAILVHHGIIWNFERPLYKGGYRERVRLLLENNINLYAYHLPLDAHPDIGNNAQICKHLGLDRIESFGAYKGQLIGMKGTLEKTNKTAIFKKIETVMNRNLLVYPYGPEMVETVAVISGGGHKDLAQAVAAKIDLFITGEVGEHIMHYAKEEKIHFISAGHYTTETFGVRALGEHISQRFKIETVFIDIPNPA
jgi:dinuclear metal center YbgI/SA1388 family protein